MVGIEKDENGTSSSHMLMVLHFTTNVLTFDSVNSSRKTTSDISASMTYAIPQRHYSLIRAYHAKIISERLGHGNITTTMNFYGHALQSADQAAAEKLESLFSSRKEKNDKKTLG
ncbi:hypothetical protein [Paenibacillus apis]|uniref:Tyr recombinase domain-containing protein n=1 Tax=Paenibacillus apis TaxID=1792174 RepID=A0A920CN40_9BACL|nr:hypothetical protein [Paenibacillus apis]GIO43168.1 hypothetical protein J41TS4_29260 [Paenibacillus apis]